MLVEQMMDPGSRLSDFCRCYTLIASSPGARQGRARTVGEWWNGRHAGFRCQCAISAWGFKSPLAHQPAAPLVGVFAGSFCENSAISRAVHGKNAWAGRRQLIFGRPKPFTA
jgi:hypothetical protein